MEINHLITYLMGRVWLDWRENGANLTCLICAVVNHNVRVDVGHVDQSTAKISQVFGEVYNEDIQDISLWQTKF